jgi:Fe-S-cluster containining protein
MSQEFLDKNGLKMDAMGHCEKLVDNQCSIYEDRPEACRVKGDYRLTAKICNMLMKAEGKMDFIKDTELMEIKT